MNRKLLRFGVFALAVSTRSLSPAAGKPNEQAPSVHLNLSAFEHARRLLESGHVVNDVKGRWWVDKPSTDRENAFLREYGFAEYTKWHLGIDDRHPENTKARYKFPYGDFKNVHRCGLIAVKSRALEYGYSEIAAAADKLMAEIETRNPRR
jgi:hypothetical protein